ncbi:aldo/keto reductase [Mahella australiensis]|uniref:Aldo/keto reductase n=1 Tax=Mahella australiensis (strain DSM 15567 / CIP 107919 / 50-1 BON) TaxID=697281 RepID=F3ZYA5_MAHA5|nr:aldo/keto reductase [Mahella australiensis]AEE95630.1 aldo/keto reductase [Mahella australiensis 50-1 BON]
MYRGLEKRKLGNTGNGVTFIGFGALEIGRDWGLGDDAERSRPDEPSACIVLNGILDLGINLIDTARAYHKSEERIGKCISNRRAEYFLASKCGEHSDEPGTYYDFSYKAVKDSIDYSLKMLKTDCIDLMQVHFGPNPQKVLDDGETVAAMKDAQREGKIRFLGASAGGDIARQCIESGDFDVMQMEYNLINRSDEKLIELCGQKGIGVLVRGGLAAGRLTSRVIPHLSEDISDKQEIMRLLALVDNDGDKLAAMALAFLYSNPNISSVILGSKNLDHIRRNFDLLEQGIDQNLLARL